MVDPDELSRRERQIIESVMRLRRATVADVRAAMSEPPSYSAVRTTMGILVDKGHLKYAKDGRRYVYRIARKPSSLRRKALKDLVHNFFDDSAEQLVQTLLDPASRRLSDADLDRIARVVADARKRRE